MPERSEEIDAPAADPPPLDCNNAPPTGEHAMLGGDSEIFVSFMNGNIALQIDKLDNDGTGPDLLVDWGWKDTGGYRNLVIYPAVAMADLDGDGKDEVVSSFMDGRKYLQTVSLKNPEAEKASLAFDYLEDGRYTWAELGEWWASIDVAAGNLNATSGHDDADEVVVAFSDRNHDLNVVLYNGESDGGITTHSAWKSTANGRGNANSVNVDVGDLDGDGADSYDFNGNGTPDYLYAVIAGPENSGNNVFYRIAFDVSAEGIPKEYGPWIPIWNSIGNLSAGLGVALTELNGNDTPELLVAWVNAPPGEDDDYYRVIWDLAADGKFSSMGDWKEIPGEIGSAVQGARLDIVDLNGNGRPELFFGCPTAASGLTTLRPGPALWPQ